MQTVWTLLRKLNKKWVAKHTLDANQATQGPIKKKKTETLCAVQCMTTACRWMMTDARSAIRC